MVGGHARRHAGRRRRHRRDLQRGDRRAPGDVRDPRARAADVGAWLGGTRPFLVAEDEHGEIVGFARVSAYSDRCVYEGVGEHGVYVSGAARGRGAGRALLEALCAAAEAAGYYKLTSRIFTTNAASRALHRATGFAEVGIQRRHGRLDGEWRDCVLVERLLGEAAEGARVV